MLPRILTTILLLACWVLTGKLVYDATMVECRSTPWLAGVLFVLAMSALSYGLLRLDQLQKLAHGQQQKLASEAVLHLYGIAYTVASSIVYAAWGYGHMTKGLSAAVYVGFFALFVVVTAVAMVALGSSDNQSILHFPAWCFGLMTVATILYLAYKYVVAGSKWMFFPFVGELIIVIAGAALLLGTHVAATEQQAIQRSRANAEEAAHPHVSGGD